MITARFQSTGTLRADSFYIERQADAQLLSALDAGEFCYVLGQRQIGKSSLRSRTERRLRERGVRTVHIDLTALGSEATAAEWYYALISTTSEQLDIEEAGRAHFSKSAGVPPTQRWLDFLRRVLLAQVSSRVVIFIDEIDKTQALPFPRDDFFAGLRALYNARVDQPELQRLTFCVLGSVAHQDLMSDVKQTPFNIGRAVELGDFSREEVQWLRPGLQAISADPEAVVAAIFSWTDGHPYMTQRLCEDVLARGAIPAGEEAQRVELAVKRTFLLRGLEDPSLGHAAKFFFAEGTEGVSATGTLKPAHPLAAEMLALYRDLLAAEVPLKPDDEVHRALWFTGMAARRRSGGEPILTVRNRIFRTVFDAQWIEKVGSRISPQLEERARSAEISGPAPAPPAEVRPSSAAAFPSRPAPGVIALAQPQPLAKSLQENEDRSRTDSSSITTAFEKVGETSSSINSQLISIRDMTERQVRETAAATTKAGDRGAGRTLAFLSAAGIIGAILLGTLAKPLFTVSSGPKHDAAGSASTGQNPPGVQDGGTLVAKRDPIRDMTGDAMAPLPPLYAQVTKKVIPIQVSASAEDGVKPKNGAQRSRKLLFDRETVTNNEFAQYLNRSASAVDLKVDGRRVFDEDQRLIIDLSRSPGISRNDKGLFVAEREASGAPVLGVSAHGAKDYCRTRSAHLPTLAQYRIAEDKVAAQLPEMVRSEAKAQGAPNVSVVVPHPGGSGIVRPKYPAAAPPAGFRCVASPLSYEQNVQSPD